MDTVSIIGPVFLLIIVGYLVGMTSLFKDGAKETLISYLWYIAIPALIFSAIASSPLPSGDDFLLVASYYGGLYLIYGFSMLIAKWVFKRPLAEQSVYAFTICFGNGVFIGLPVIEGVYGAEGVRLFIILLSFHSSSLLMISTIFVERGLSSDKPTAEILKETSAAFIKNPILVALFTGIIWTALGLPFPPILERITDLPAQSAAPVGLFTAGLALGGVKIAGDMVQAVTGSLFKLILVPITIFIMTNYVFQLPPMWVGVAVLMSALPSGVVAYSFAMKYNTAARRSASIVLLSTGGSIITLSVLIGILS